MNNCPYAEYKNGVYVCKLNTVFGEECEMGLYPSSRYCRLLEQKKGYKITEGGDQ